jgi:hypothetical protein
MLYLLLHDSDSFHSRITPALAAGWRSRSFGPLGALAGELRSQVRIFAEQFHLTAGEQPLLLRLSADQPFNRRLWRHLAGEVLLYAAADAPPIQTAAETLAALVAADQREVIAHAHRGSRDLDFDGVLYRPGCAGINEVPDVASIAKGLATIDAEGWDVNDLPPDMADEPAEELAFAVECFAALRDLYVGARGNNYVVICEEI